MNHMITLESLKSSLFYLFFYLSGERPKRLQNYLLVIIIIYINIMSKNVFYILGHPHISMYPPKQKYLQLV